MQKIFIIDDDLSFIKMLERAFAPEKCLVEHALEGADAIAKLYVMDAMPSVILLDIMIPVLSGPDVLKLIKNSDKLKYIPVIILSNLTPPTETEESIVALGALVYLHKADYTTAQIVEKVNEVLKTAP